MTREEMIERLDNYCKKRDTRMFCGCDDCPIRVDENGYCKYISDRTDEELAACIEKIVTTGITEKEKREDPEHVETGDQKVEVIRMLHMINGGLMMLSSCVGMTITNEIADELMNMAKSIDRAIKEKL